MKTIRSKSGPFLERPYFRDAEIEKLCTDELRKVELYPSQPEAIRIDRFLEKCFDVTPTYERLPDGVLGFTKFGINGVTEIVVSERLEGDEGTPSERRLRATLAHEGGHGLMHAYLFRMGTKPASLFEGTDNAPEIPEILCRDVPGETKVRRGYDGRWWELQANKAIGGLLMPRGLVDQALQDFVIPSGSFGQVTIPTEKRETAVRELVNIFNVNPVVARIRLSDLLPSENDSQLSL